VIPIGRGRPAFPGLPRRQDAQAGRWLLAAVPAGVAAGLLLGLIDSQSF
jgi:hypothetical protein